MIHSLHEHELKRHNAYERAYTPTRSDSGARGWRRAFRYVRVLVVLVSALWMSAAFGLRDGAIYVGAMSDGGLVFMQLEIDVNGSAYLSVRGEPDPAGVLERPHFEAQADPEWSSSSLTLTGSVHDWLGGSAGSSLGEPSGSGESRAAAEVRVWAAVHEHDRTLDPFGFAVLTISPKPGADSHGADAPGTAAERLEVRLAAVGTMYRSELELMDGSFMVSRTAPLFYDATWLGLDLIAAVEGGLDAAKADGLRLRRESPSGMTARWADERLADVMSLSGRVVSVLYRSYSYTGGAHPNTFKTAETYLRQGDAWSRANLCQALDAIGLACDPQSLRERVIRDLEAQQAAWVVAGDVHAGTPWLLDTFTLTATALRFDFSPYQVGPYVSGPFTVTIPYVDLAAQVMSGVPGRPFAPGSR